MTTLALQGLNLFEGIGKFIKKTYQGIVMGMMISRQTQANQEIVKQMMQHGEYRHGDHTYYSLLADLNARTIASIKAEFKDNA